MEEPYRLIYINQADDIIHGCSSSFTQQPPKDRPSEEGRGLPHQVPNEIGSKQGK